MLEFLAHTKPKTMETSKFHHWVKVNETKVNLLQHRTWKGKKQGAYEGENLQTLKVQSLIKKNICIFLLKYPKKNKKQGKYIINLLLPR